MSGTTETMTFRPKRQQRTEALALRRAHDERMDRAAPCCSLRAPRC